MCFPEMEGHEFFFLYVVKASDKKATIKNTVNVEENTQDNT